MDRVLSNAKHKNDMRPYGVVYATQRSKIRPHPRRKTGRNQAWGQMQKEGVVQAPPLEWDGSLGPEEEKVIDRLGFLLNAYTVQAWWWELVE